MLLPLHTAPLPSPFEKVLRTHQVGKALLVNPVVDRGLALTVSLPRCEPLRATSPQSASLHDIQMAEKVKARSKSMCRQLYLRKPTSHGERPLLQRRLIMDTNITRRNAALYSTCA